MIIRVALYYLLFINFLAFLITVYDKKASMTHGKKKWSRIPEKYLLFVGVLGGSLAMYITMKKIRHKTHHKRFMKGLPTILTVQFILLMAALMFFL